MNDNEPLEAPDPQDFTDASPNPTFDAELVALCDQLRERGVTRVIVRYSGSGDSGCIDAIEYLPEGTALPRPLEDRLEGAAENYCPAGYENNDGGYGALTLYPEQALAELEHSDCYEESEDMAVASVPLPMELQSRLSRRGITSVSAEFNGYGDSGQLEGFAVQPESAELGDKLADALEGFLFEQLPGGWEINAGSYGDFFVDVPAGEVMVEASWRIERGSNPEVIRWQGRR